MRKNGVLLNFLEAKLERSKDNFVSRFEEIWSGNRPKALSHPLHKTIHHALLAGLVELNRQLVAVDGGDVAVAEFLVEDAVAEGEDERLAAPPASGASSTVSSSNTPSGT